MIDLETTANPGTTYSTRSLTWYRDSPELYLDTFASVAWHQQGFKIDNLGKWNNLEGTDSSKIITFCHFSNCTQSLDRFEGWISAVDFNRELKEPHNVQIPWIEVKSDDRAGPFQSRSWSWSPQSTATPFALENSIFIFKNIWEYVLYDLFVCLDVSMTLCHTVWTYNWKQTHPTSSGRWEFCWSSNKVFQFWFRRQTCCLPWEPQ